MSDGDNGCPVPLNAATVGCCSAIGTVENQLRVFLLEFLAVFIDEASEEQQCLWFPL